VEGKQLNIIAWAYRITTEIQSKEQMGASQRPFLKNLCPFVSISAHVQKRPPITMCPQYSMYVKQATLSPPQPILAMVSENGLKGYVLESLPNKF
jgi:hypothetical protein